MARSPDDRWMPPKGSPWPESRPSSGGTVECSLAAAAQIRLPECTDFRIRRANPEAWFIEEFLMVAGCASLALVLFVEWRSRSVRYFQVPSEIHWLLIGGGILLGTAAIRAAILGISIVGRVSTDNRRHESDEPSPSRSPLWCLGVLFLPVVFHTLLPVRAMCVGRQTRRSSPWSS
jgi:hypothetical protein